MDDFHRRIRRYHASHVCPELGLPTEARALCLSDGDGARWLWIDAASLAEEQAERSLRLGQREARPDPARFRLYPVPKRPPGLRRYNAFRPARRWIKYDHPRCSASSGP